MKWLAIAKKDIKILLKDPSAIVTLLLLPILFITIMSFALSDTYGVNKKKIEIIYIDNDKSEASRDFIKNINSSKDIIAKKNEKQKELDLKAKIDDSEYPMLLIIPEGFSEDLEDGIMAKLQIYVDSTQLTTTKLLELAIDKLGDKFTLEKKIKELSGEQSNYTMDVISNFQKTLAMDLQQEKNFEKYNEDISFEVSEGTLENVKNVLTKTYIKQVVEIDTVNKEVPDTYQQNIPAYTVMFAFFIILFAGKSFLSEKESGTWNRILTSNIGKTQVYIGKFVPNFIIGVIQITTLFLIGRVIFGMSLGESKIGLIVLSLSLIMASTSLGLVVSVVAKTDAQVTGISLVIVLSTAALGGTMVPLSLMPDAMQKIAMFVPQSWALNGYQDILVRNMGISDIRSNIIMLLVFSILFLSFSILRIRKMR